MSLSWLIYLVCIIAAFAVVYWGLQQFPLPPTIKTVIIVIMALVALAFIASLFGGYGGLRLGHP